MFYEYIKTSKLYDVIWRPFWNFAYRKGYLLFRKGIDISIENEHRSEDGRILLINIMYQEKHYTFVNIYAHNNDNQRVTFFEKVKNWILKY